MVGCEHAAALLDSLAAAESRSLICYDDSDVRRSAPTRATWGFNAEVRADLAAPTWQGIVNVADEIDAAVIVLGSRGLGAARELLEGSVSHEVAEHAGRPVLIVPPPAGRRWQAPRWAQRYTPHAGASGFAPTIGTITDSSPRDEWQDRAGGSPSHAFPQPDLC